MDAATVKQLIREELAELDVNRSFDLMGDGELWRYWPDLLREDMDACRSFLETYTSVSNTVASRTVASPQANRRPFAGTWRQLGVELRRDNRTGKLNLYQGLRLNTAGPQVSTASERALLFAGDTLAYRNSLSPIHAPAAGQHGLYRAESNLTDKGTYNGEMSYRQGYSATAGFAAGESLLEAAAALLYHEASTPAGAPAAGRGGVYQATNSITELGGYDGRLGYERGLPASVGFGHQRAMWTGGRTIEYRNWDAIITVPADFAGTGLYRATCNINRFSLYDGALEYVYGLLSGFVAHESLRSVVETEDAIVYRESATPIRAGATGRGGLYQATNSITELGGYDGRLGYEQGLPASVEFGSQRALFTAGQTINYRNWDAIIAVPAAFAGTGLYRATCSINRVGLYDGSLEYLYGRQEAGVSFASLRSAAESEETRLYRESPVPVIAPEGGAGFIYQASNNITELGGYDGALQYQLGRGASVRFNSFRTIFTAGRTIQYRNWDVPISVPETLTASGMYRATCNFNRFNLYDGALEYTYGTNEGAVGFASERGYLTTQDAITYRDWPTPPTAPEADDGLYRANCTITEEGFYVGSVEYARGVARAAQFTRETLAASGGNTVVDVYRNLASIPAAPENAQGHVYSQDFSLNALRRADGQRVHRYRAPLAFGPVVVTRSDNLPEYQYVYEAWTEQVAVPAGWQGRSIMQRDPLDNTWSGSLILHGNDFTVGLDWANDTSDAFSFVSTRAEPCYCYTLWTSNATHAFDHLEAKAVTTATIVGGRDGHVTNAQPLGGARWRAVRVEAIL